MRSLWIRDIADEVERMMAEADRGRDQDYRAGSSRVSETIEVPAPASVIFAILVDPRQHPRIDGSGTVRGVVEGPSRLERGTSFGVRMRMFGVPYRIANQVVEFDQDRLIAWRHFAGHRWRYELEPVAPTVTLVTETFDFSRLGPISRAIVRLLRFPEKNLRGIEATLPRLAAAAQEDQRDPGVS